MKKIEIYSSNAQLIDAIAKARYKAEYGDDGELLPVDTADVVDDLLDLLVEKNDMYATTKLCKLRTEFEKLARDSE